jgi:hypothetical protein
MPKPFSVTLWFKKGELDAGQALEAAQGEDDLHPGAFDLLPIEDRYIDDGSVTAEDASAFSLRGQTRAVPMIGAVTTGNPGDGIARLVRDMKRGRNRALAMVGASLLVVSTLVLYMV